MSADDDAVARMPVEPLEYAMHAAAIGWGLSDPRSREER